MKIGYDAKRIFHNATGLGNFSRDLLRTLSKFYPKNDYFLYNPKIKRNQCLELSKEMKEVLPKSKIWKKLSSIWRQGPITKQLLQDKIKIYHGLTGEIPRGIEKTSIKTVVTIHDLIFVRYPELYSFVDRKIYFKKILFAVQNANRIVAISEQTKKDIINFLKVDSKKIDVIYQGCHAVFKESQTAVYKKTVIEKFNLPDCFILNVGTIEKRKNLLTLVKSIKNVDVSLIVVGKKTPYYREIHAYIKENNLKNKIYFLEGVSLQELASLYQIATIFVYPSVFEGFGIPIIEALYSKTPVITSINGVFSEAGGENSTYVAPLNVNDLRDAIVNLLSSKTKRDKMSILGYEFVQKFNNQNIADSYMKLYNNL